MKTNTRPILLFSFLSSLIFVVTCSTEPEEKPSFVHPIIGSWKWIESLGGWGQHLTPESEGYSKTVEFKSDLTYKEFRDNEELEVSEFKIVNKPVWGSETSKEDVLIIEGHTFEQIITFQNNDTLHLSEYCVDCSEHYYVRMQSN